MWDKEKDLYVLEQLEKGVSARQVAIELNLSTTRIRQLEKQAKRKYRTEEQPKEKTSLDFINDEIAKYKSSFVQNKERYESLRKCKNDLEILYRMRDYFKNDFKGNMVAQCNLISAIQGFEKWLK